MRLILLIIFALFISACSVQLKTIPTSTSIHALSQPIIITSTAPNTPTMPPPSATAVPSHTATRFIPTSVSHTPSFTPTPTSQETPFPIPSPNATVVSLGEQWNVDSHMISLSPNGEWATLSFQSPVEVTNIVTGLKRVAPCTLFLRSCSAIREIHWSKDSHYLYLASIASYGETSMAQPLFSELGRLEVESGKFEKLVENLDETEFGDGVVGSTYTYDFAISPDDQYIAYVKSSYQGDKPTVEFAVLTINNLREKEKRTLDKSVAGNILWSPSSDHLVFQADADIAFYDLPTGILRYVVQNVQEYSLLMLDWEPQTNLVQLRKETWYDRVWSYWYLNPFTGQILPAPTPIP